MKLRIASLATACVLTLQGVAFATEPVDSVTVVVADFLSANLKQGIEQAVNQLQSYGLTVNRTQLDSLLMADFGLPYDATRHQQAAQKVAELMASANALRNEELLKSAELQEHVIKLSSGVIINVHSWGSGDAPTENSIVTMRYVGLLPDGTIFDEITEDAEPMQARVGDLAPGLVEAFAYMLPGARYTVTIPAPLAYGAEGVPGVIPPDSALQFIIDFISFSN